MALGKTAKSNKGNTETPEILHAILEELRLLRKEMASLALEDRLEEYEHADRVKQSYQNAVREHPPASYPSWR